MTRLDCSAVWHDKVMWWTDGSGLCFLFSSGHLDITIALQLSEYLVDETEYVPWQIGLEALRYISGLVEGHPDYMYFKVNTFLLL